MYTKLIYFVAALMLLPIALQGAVALEVTSSRSSIYQGESFNLTLSVNGADAEIEPPDFASSDPAEIVLLGSHSNSRSSIQIINGRMTREVFRGRVFSYAIKPKDKGLYKTGPIIVTVAGAPSRHNGVTVQVKGVEKQERVIVTVKASSESVLVEEPFSITLSVAVQELPEPYSQSNEPLHASNLPQITADFLEIREGKTTLVAPDLNPILNALIDQSGREPSFAINNYKSRGMGFGSFFNSDPFEARPIRFRLPRTKVEINGKHYREYTLKLNYTATGEGEHTFGPVTFKGQVISDVTAQREAVFEDIYAIGGAVTVRVTPPPDQGRPEYFIGSVGRNMLATAQFDTTLCKVGDPLTLTLEITGDISITNLRTPTLSLQPDLTRNFRIYDENVKTETLPKGKRFTYRVRPTVAGTLEFPPIKIAYYDSDARAYKTITTAPLPIQAEATTQVASMEDAAAGGVIEVRRAMPMPCGITLTPEGVTNGSLIPEMKLLLPLLLGMPLLTLLFALLRPLVRAIKFFKARRVKSGALAKALRTIRHAQSSAELAQAVRSYLSQRLDTAGQSLTGIEIETVLRDWQLPLAERSAFSQLIDRLDEAMYKPGKESPRDQMRADCIASLKAIDAALQHSPSSTAETKL
ncbi:MAG: BatD family protein [Kiritimatiellae bacterium]|nr:BatD family protein [Kiritimatiellia bacterium]